MTWKLWAEELKKTPLQAVSDLIRGAADIAPFERLTPHEFLLTVLPVESRTHVNSLTGSRQIHTVCPATQHLVDYLDKGLAEWLMIQQYSDYPSPKKLSAYAHQVSDALQWPLYFKLPRSRSILVANRACWLKWLSSLTLSAFLDPEYDYWQVLASQQQDESLQFFWQSFITEARRTRPARYLNLGLLSLAKLPLDENDTLKNLRLQVQSLINRYQRRKGIGISSQDELATNIKNVMARNPTMNDDNYRAFLRELLKPVGEDVTLSVFSLIGLQQQTSFQQNSRGYYKVPAWLKPPGTKEDTDSTIKQIHQSTSLLQAWEILRREITIQENYLYRTGDSHNFLRVLDRCVREICGRNNLTDPEIQSRILQWTHLSLRLEPDEPRRWMLWELVLRKAGHQERAKWVLLELTRRFPDQIPGRVELALLLLESGSKKDRDEASALLKHVLEIDYHNLHARAGLASLAIQNEDWSQSIRYTQECLKIDPADAVSMRLLAWTYMLRDAPGDRDLAINSLKDFLARYADGHELSNLLKDIINKKSSVNKFKKDRQEKNMPHPKPDTEKDPAWLAFAATLATYESDSDAFITSTRILTLPQALQQAVIDNNWDEESLAGYGPEDMAEFPLEIALWRYLSLLHSSFSTQKEIESGKENVTLWIKRLAEESNHSSYKIYLHKEWEKVISDPENAIVNGKKWLLELVVRYHPLPAPLFS